MIKRHLYILVFYGLLTSLGNAQELKFVTPLTVPDSVSTLDHDFLKTTFVKKSAFTSTKKDSLRMEYYGKELIKSRVESKLDADLAMFYISLARLRDNNVEILDYAIILARRLDDAKILCEAYLRKAENFYANGNYVEAYNNALVGYDYSISSGNNYYKWFIKYFISLIQTQFGDRQEGITKLKEVEEIFLDGRVKNIFPYNSDANNLIMLADIQYAIAMASHETLNFDQALFYIDKVGAFASHQFDSDYFDSYIGLKGAILTRQGNFKEGLAFTNDYLHNNEKNDPEELSRSYAVQGIAYAGLELKEEALQSFLTSDSLHVIGGSDFYYSELSETYEYLFDHYKSVDDAPHQIEFLNKIITYEQATADLKSDIGQQILKDYSIPQLVAQKESLILELEQKSALGYQWGVLASFAAMLGIIFSFFQFRKRLLLKKRFNNIKDELLHVGAAKDKKVNIKSANPPLAQLKAVHIEQIAIGLEKFEKDALFLKSTVSLKSLAKQIGTNSSYLSKYVNSVKSDNFSTYVNDLRIQYVVQELYTSKKLSSYTIQAIANEIGFTTAKSFSTHFKRVTGLSVSYFLKKLELQKKSESEAQDPSVIDFIDHINRTG